MSEAIRNLPLEIQIGALSPSAREIFYLLRYKKLTPSQIQRKTTYSPRTVRFALRKLLDLRLVEKIPNLKDLRRISYRTVTP